MRIVIQRVLQASVSIDNNTVGLIGSGVLALVGFGKLDPHPELLKAIKKLLNLRIFENVETGKLDHSLLDTHGGLLLVPQFTVYGSANKGRRPGFQEALAPRQAKVLFTQMVEIAKASYDGPIASGRFGANMQVALINDGPMTLILDI